MKEKVEIVLFRTQLNYCKLDATCLLMVNLHHSV